MEYRYTFSLSGDSLCIMRNGETLFSDMTGYLKYDGTHYDVITSARHGTWSVSGLTASCASMTLELKPYREGFLLRSSFTNTEDHEIPAFCEYTAFAGCLHRTLDRAIVNSYVYANGNRVNEMQGTIECPHGV